MGTVYTLFLYAASRSKARDEAEKSFAIVDEADALLSNYRPQSELSRINREAYAGPITTDPENFRFLEDSFTWSARSNGAFDLTVGALMQAWGFFRSTGRVPAATELAAVRARTGWRYVRLDAASRTVRFLRPGIQLDPGGIGKGFAVERVASMLRSDGVQAALVSAGSSTIDALGAPPGQPGWRINVPDPSQSGATLAAVFLRDTSLSTASCAPKHFVLHGHLYCSIMDPGLGTPVEGRLQVTVITPDATDGDALSNVMFVEDAAARADAMRHLPLADSALVISGTPAEDTNTHAEGKPQSNGMTRVAACDSYRWPGPLPRICHPAAYKATLSEENR